MVDDDDNKWIRECSQIENFMEFAHQQEVMILSYGFTLNSVKPLQEYYMQRALLHLLRKIPTLSVCLRPRNEKLWFHRMEHEKVDFKVLKNANFQDEFNLMNYHHYDVFEGPLWCVRLLPCPWDEKCPMPHIKEKFPNQYKLLFGIHHSITDGFSTMKICNSLLSLLNDVISGKPINDHELLAYHASAKHIEKRMNLIANEFKANPEELQRVKSSLDSKTEVLLFQADPLTKESPRTLSITRELNEEQTSMLLQRCKMEGVSLHSAYSTAANATIVNLLLREGLEQDSFEIPSGHALNLRRFWDEDIDPSTALGCHISYTSTTVTCSRNIEKEFWNHARNFHDTLQTGIKDNFPLKQNLARIISMQESKNPDALMEMFTQKPTVYYNTINMGNLASFLHGEGEHVQYTSLCRTTSTRGVICSHVFQTFRGRLLFGLDYDTSFMTSSKAESYIDLLADIIVNSV